MVNEKHIHPSPIPETFVCRHCFRRLKKDQFQTKNAGTRISVFCQECVARALKDIKRKKQHGC